MNEFHRYCTYFGCEYIEISNGTLPMTNKEKAAFIADFSDEFLVLSEVGGKDAELASRQSSEEWLEYIVEDMEAGAEKVITEARESGTGGICSSGGDVRFQIVDDIISSDIDINRLIFEAPNKTLQQGFIQKSGRM